MIYELCGEELMGCNSIMPGTVTFSVKQSFHETPVLLQEGRKGGWGGGGGGGCLEL